MEGDGAGRSLAADAIAVAIEMSRIAGIATPYRRRAGSARGAAVGEMDRAFGVGGQTLARRREIRVRSCRCAGRGDSLRNRVHRHARPRLRPGQQERRTAQRAEWSSSDTPHAPMRPRDVITVATRVGGGCLPPGQVGGARIGDDGSNHMPRAVLKRRIGQGIAAAKRASGPEPGDGAAKSKTGRPRNAGPSSDGARVGSARALRAAAPC